MSGHGDAGLFLLLAAAGFLWFVGVIRTRLGEHEPKLFATVFFGGGVLLVALLLAGSAAARDELADRREIPARTAAALVLLEVLGMAYDIANCVL